MLNPSKDREDYSKMLTPPYGYETVFAVGTTYSLDLDALIGASIALGLSESIDSELRDDPIYLLEAVRKTSDKILIFCEAGSIKSPIKSNELYIFLEQMVVEIIIENGGSFHPKFWLVKYENEAGDNIYRCIVLSRNLTFDRSWDVAVSIEGRSRKDNILGKEQTKSKPISDFLKALVKLSKREELTSEKRELVLNLAHEILNIRFELDEKKFKDYSFCPVGIEGYPIENTNLFNTYHELFIITPFLSSSIINSFNKLALRNEYSNTLITRRLELHKLKKTMTNNFNVYALKDIIIDGENIISEDEEDITLREIQKQDIHAKVYLRTKGENSELVLGSLNASYNACYKNIEFMFKLYGEKKYLNVDFLKEDLFGEDDKENPFEIVEIKEREKVEPTILDNLEKRIKEVCRIKSNAKIIESESNYSIELRFEELERIKDVFIRPLLLGKGKKEKELSSYILIEDLRMDQLSEFYVIKAYSGDKKIERVIKIKTENMPETRESSVVNSIINDENGFIKYITFILGDNYLLSMFENTIVDKNSRMFGSGQTKPALYEKMLKAAVHSKGKFNEIKSLLGLITGDNIIPDGFLELYEIFEKVIDNR